MQLRDLLAQVASPDDRNISPMDPSKLPSASIVKAMALTPEEQFLYQHHVNNLLSGQISHEKGGYSSIYQTPIPDTQNGVTTWRNIPTVWDGRHPERTPSRNPRSSSRTPQVPRLCLTRGSRRPLYGDAQVPRT